jgi:hypothetical protein
MRVRFIKDYAAWRVGEIDDVSNSVARMAFADNAAVEITDDDGTVKDFRPPRDKALRRESVRAK